MRLSDGSSCIVPAEVVAGEALSTGAALDDDRLQSLRSRSEFVLARSRALSLISRSEGAVTAESWLALPYEEHLKLLAEVRG